MWQFVCLWLLGEFYWCSRHLWLWGLQQKQFWAVLHKLRQRDSSLLFQSAYFQVWTGRVSTRSHSLDRHWIYRQHSLSWALQQEADGTAVSAWWRMQVSSSSYFLFSFICEHSTKDWCEFVELFAIFSNIWAVKCVILLMINYTVYCLDYCEYQLFYIYVNEWLNEIQLYYKLLFKFIYIVVCILYPAFYYARKQLCFQRVLAIAILSVCPSVCLSHGWIRQKQSKLGSPNLHHRLFGRLWFQER